MHVHGVWGFDIQLKKSTPRPRGSSHGAIDVSDADRVGPALAGMVHGRVPPAPAGWSLDRPELAEAPAVSLSHSGIIPRSLPAARGAGGPPREWLADAPFGRLSLFSSHEWG